jgi:hypothetical protein
LPEAWVRSVNATHLTPTSDTYNSHHDLARNDIDNNIDMDMDMALDLDIYIGINIHRHEHRQYPCTVAVKPRPKWGSGGRPTSPQAFVFRKQPLASIAEHSPLSHAD